MSSRRGTFVGGAPRSHLPQRPWQRSRGSGGLPCAAWQGPSPIRRASPATVSTEETGKRGPSLHCLAGTLSHPESQPSHGVPEGRRPCHPPRCQMPLEAPPNSCAARGPAPRLQGRSSQGWVTGWDPCSLPQGSGERSQPYWPESPFLAPGRRSGQLMPLELLGRGGRPGLRPSGRDQARCPAERAHTGLSSVCSGASSWPGGQDATCSRDPQRFPGVPPNHGSACATSVSLSAAHIAFSRATAGGAHTVGSPCSLQGPGAEGSWRRASSFHPPKTHTCIYASTHPNTHTRFHTPVHWRTRVLTDTLAHKWRQAPRRLQGPLPSARAPVPWPPLVRGSAAAVSSPWRDLQPPARRAHGACRCAQRALKRGIDRETEAGLKPSAPLSSCFSLAQGC